MMQSRMQAIGDFATLDFSNPDVLKNLNIATRGGQFTFELDGKDLIAVSDDDEEKIDNLYDLYRFYARAHGLNTAALGLTPQQEQELIRKPINIGTPLKKQKGNWFTNFFN